MKILEDGTIRIEYKDYDTGTYLYKDITAEFLREQKEKKNMLFTVRNDYPDEIFKNGFNDIAKCRFMLSPNICEVDVTQYGGEEDKFWVLPAKF